MKIDIALEKYLKYRRYIEKITPNTLILHRGVLTRFMQFISTQREEIPELDSIGLDDLIEYCEYLEIAEFARGKGYGKKIHLSHNTQVLHQRCIQKFFKRCYISRLMESEIYHMPVGKFIPNELIYLSKEEVQQFFDITKTAKNPIKRLRDELLFRIAYFTGLRKSEILNLTFDQLLDNDQFQIQGKWREKELSFLTTSPK